MRARDATTSEFPTTDPVASIGQTPPNGAVNETVAGFAAETQSATLAGLRATENMFRPIRRTELNAAAITKIGPAALAIAARDEVFMRLGKSSEVGQFASQRRQAYATSGETPRKGIEVVADINYVGTLGPSGVYVPGVRRTKLSPSAVQKQSTELALGSRSYRPPAATLVVTGRCVWEAPGF